MVRGKKQYYIPTFFIFICIYPRHAKHYEYKSSTDVFPPMYGIMFINPFAKGAYFPPAHLTPSKRIIDVVYVCAKRTSKKDTHTKEKNKF